MKIDDEIETEEHDRKGIMYCKIGTAVGDRILLIELHS